MFATPCIDFARPQGVVRPHARRAGWLLLVLSLVAAASLAGVYFAVLQRTQTADAYVEHLRHGAQAPVASLSSMSKEAAAEVAAVNRAASRLAIPWSALFQALEAAKGERTAILAIQPNAQQGEIRLLGEADDFAAITEFLVALGAQPGLGGARLISHEVRAPGQIQFEITAKWLLSR